MTTQRVQLPQPRSSSGVWLEEKRGQGASMSIEERIAAFQQQGAQGGWSGGRAAGSNAHEPLEVQDISSGEESVSTQSLLESDTRYLPLHSEMLATNQHPLPLPSNLPTQAAPSSAHHQGPPKTSFAEIFAQKDEDSVSSSAAEGAASTDTHVDTGHTRRLAAHFSNMSTPPQAAGNFKPPQQSTRSASPSPRGKDWIDAAAEAGDGAPATLELKLLKAILASRKTRKGGRSDALHPSTTEYLAQYQEVINSTQDTSGQDLPQNTSQEEQELERSMAATKLQALWRGFLVRQRNPQAKKVSTEMRNRRAEQHIRFLSQQLDKQRHKYEQEKQLRLLQLEAVKMLWKEVQSLQTWKEQVLHSQEQALLQLSGNTSFESLQQSHTPLSTKQLLEALEKAGVNPALAVGASLAVSSGQASGGSVRSASIDVDTRSPQPTAKEAELEGACKHLQKQVSELQDVLSAISGQPFPAANAPTQPSQGREGDIRVSGDFDSDSLNEVSVVSVAEVPPPPALPPPGIPTAPGNLSAQSHSNSSLILHWQRSAILDAQGQPANKPLLGYRLYINNRAKGLVAGTQTRALLEGLDPKLTYRIFIRAVSALGESQDSNMVEVTLGQSSSGRASPNIPDDSPGPGGGSRSHGGSRGGSSGSRGHSGGRDSSHTGSSHPAPSKHSSHGQSGEDAGHSREGRHKRSTVSERLEVKGKSCLPNKGRYELSSEEGSRDSSPRQAGNTDLSSSPRIQEGLIKRLDQVKEKSMMGELKFAAKMHKRKPSPESPTPMRAMAKEERDWGVTYDVAPVTQKTKYPDVSAEEVALAVEKSYFKRQNSLKYRKKRSGSPQTVESADSGPKYGYKVSPGRARTESGSENDDLGTSYYVAGSTKEHGGSRRQRTSSTGSEPGEENLDSNSGGALRLYSHHSQPVTPTNRADHASEKKRNSYPKTKEGEAAMVRHSRGRSSARERVANKEYTAEKRSSSVGAVDGRDSPHNLVTDKPPKAKTREGWTAVPKSKPARTSSRDESSRARMRHKSDSQGSSEDEELVRSRGRHQSGSSSSEHEGSAERRSEKLNDAKAQAKKKALFKHKRSSSDFSGISVLPDRPESPAPKERKAPSPTPKQAPSSPRVRRSSSFSKAQPDSPGKEGEALLRQCISLEMLKAAKSQDTRGASSGEEHSADPVPDLPPPRIDAKALIRRSMERLHRKTPVEGVLKAAEGSEEGVRVMGDVSSLQPRGRSMSFGTSPASAPDTVEEPIVSEVRASNTAPAVLMTDSAEEASAVPVNKETVLDDIPAQEHVANAHRIGTKAAHLFARLQLKLSANNAS